MTPSQSAQLPAIRALAAEMIDNAAEWSDILDGMQAVTPEAQATLDAVRANVARMDRAARWINAAVERVA